MITQNDLWASIKDLFDSSFNSLEKFISCLKL